MAIHKGLMHKGFALPECEKHFHDHDETWLILNGAGTGYWIDHAATREEFVLEAGDVWMIPAGFEHGSEGPNSSDFKIAVFNGTLAPGSHKPKHYYVEQEGYIPSLQLIKTPTTRYQAVSNVQPTMRGVMFAEKGKAVLQDEPTPSCPAGHILCQTVYSGLTNGTERNVLLGGNYGGTWPRRVGYQNVGRVIQAGSGVTQYRPGDLIYSGNFNQHVAYFAADVSQPDAATNLVVKLPDGIALTHAALLGMASVALHDVRRADVRIGERVLVVGAGSIGLLTAQAARACGAHVSICDLDADRLAIAKALNIQEPILITGDDTWQQLKQAEKFTVVIEDSGAPVLDKILGAGFRESILQPRGRLLMIAGRQDVTYSFNAGQGAELAVLHAGHFERSDLLEILRLISEEKIHIGPLIKEVVPIDKAIEVYERLRDKPGSLLGTVFDWQ